MKDMSVGGASSEDSADSASGGNGSSVMMREMEMMDTGTSLEVIYGCGISLRR